MDDSAMAHLHYRCAHESAPVFAELAAAAETASQLRTQQVSAATLISKTCATSATVHNWSAMMAGTAALWRACCWVCMLPAPGHPCTLTQVNVSDKVAGLMSDLAGKLLEAEASVDEATQLERCIGSLGPAEGGDEQQDKQSLKSKLMINALMQKVVCALLAGTPHT